MSHPKFRNTPLANLLVVERTRLQDHRGFFSRLFCADEFALIGWKELPVQINHSFTKKAGAVRGMHFQYPPSAEKKLVFCLRGNVWDVAADLRQNSSTFMRWHGEILSAENQRAMMIPEGFAHGFQTLSDNCELLYLHSNFYSPEDEARINPRDPVLGIDWPSAITEISEKDSQHPLVDDRFEGIVL